MPLCYSECCSVFRLSLYVAFCARFSSAASVCSWCFAMFRLPTVDDRNRLAAKRQCSYQLLLELFLKGMMGIL